MKKRENLQNRSSFFIVGKHPVIEALKNPNRKVLRVFLTEESKKTIHRTSPHKNLLKNQKSLMISIVLLTFSMENVEKPKENQSFSRQTFGKPK